MPRTVCHVRGPCLARRFGLLPRIGLGRFITLHLLVTTDRDGVPSRPAFVNCFVLRPPGAA